MVFPPWNHHEIFFEIKMQEKTHGSVELFDSILVDTFSGIFCFLVKPVSDIGACSLDDGLYLLFLSILLYEPGEVVDFAEERDPDVVGVRVGLEFRKVVESSFVVGFGELFGEVGFTHKFQFLINQWIIIILNEWSLTFFNHIFSSYTLFYLSLPTNNKQSHQSIYPKSNLLPQLIMR